MMSQLENARFPPAAGGVPFLPMPANFEPTVAAELSTKLQADIGMAPADAPDPMVIANVAATEAMPIINTHYSPHAPSVRPGSFMSRVSRKAPA